MARRTHTFRIPTNATCNRDGNDVPLVAEVDGIIRGSKGVKRKRQDTDGECTVIVATIHDADGHDDLAFRLKLPPEALRYLTST